MLSNLKCLVTGASSGIGLGACQVLTREGATVVGIGRNQPALEQLKTDGAIIDFIISDITKEGECQRVVEESVKLLGGSLTTVVNAAGILKTGAMGEDTSDLATYHANMTCNTQAPYEIMVHAIPYLKLAAEPGLASIINISSVNGKQSFPGCAAYCMSKAALDQLTRCASIDLAKYGIRVNSVNPGVIKTNIHKTSGMSDEQYENFLKRSMELTHPIASSLGRVGTSEEVGELIAFLVSTKAKFLTGECIAIDGARQNLGAR